MLLRALAGAGLQLNLDSLSIALSGSRTYASKVSRFRLLGVFVDYHDGLGSRSRRYLEISAE